VEIQQPEDAAVTEVKELPEVHPDSDRHLLPLVDNPIVSVHSEIRNTDKILFRIPTRVIISIISHKYYLEMAEGGNSSGRTGTSRKTNPT
jgi:hypothetical protein